MKLYNKIIYVVLMLHLCFTQHTVDGSPYSRIYGLNNDYYTIILPNINRDQLLEEDLKTEQPSPFRYGYKHKINFSLNNIDISQETNDGGKLFQLRLISKDAFAIGLEYENFYIPQGGELYIYSPDYEMIYGAYTHLNNVETKRFSTPLIKGDVVIIEYFHPSYLEEDFSINITNLIHDYRDIMNFSNNDRDWECGINVICETREMYQNVINSVAFLDMGAYICSGSMINNTRQDLTPYFLTAWHCVADDPGNPATYRFYFNKEASDCENTWSSPGPYAYSSEIVSDSDGMDSDWALLLITDEIEDEWGVYYSGWDATGDYPLISSGVHHPNGTGKKINYDDDRAYGDWWDDSSVLSHWKVNWDEGGNEGGSSGSPVFNDQFRIVGQLSGNVQNCSTQGQDLYGKLSRGWDNSFFANRRKIDWLDPDNTGLLILDGTYIEISSQPGDVNSDGVIDILDIIEILNLILQDEFTQNQFELSDINNDDIVNILDIIYIVNIILQ